MKIMINCTEWPFEMCVRKFRMHYILDEKIRLNIFMSYIKKCQTGTYFFGWVNLTLYLCWIAAVDISASLACTSRFVLSLFFFFFTNSLPIVMFFFFFFIVYSRSKSNATIVKDILTVTVDVEPYIIQGGPKITERHTSGNKDIRWLVSVDGVSSPEKNYTKISHFG